MDEPMGRRTVGGLLLTKGGSILVYREESPRHKATACCTRLGCSSKLFRDKEKKMRRPTKEAVNPQRSQLISGSNRLSPQGRMACGSITKRNAESTCSETGNRPTSETAGRDLLTRLKERVNASRKRSLSGGSSPSSLTTSSAGSSISGRTISRPLHRPIPRTRKDGGTTRMRSDSNGNSGGNVQRRADFQGPTGRFVSRSLFRHRSRHQGEPVSYSENNLNDSSEYWRFGLDESDEDASSDRHRGMRMDIDNMSYEELLALGETIGTVSTGLSDDELSKCLKRILYVPSASTSHEDGDIKCIVCQEEYLSDEEVAEMACKHYYHIACIQQWLRQKNWCPICKSVGSATKPYCT
uniref:RING-type E3 ubiquitin transferase n=1 Tax=Leersia perrieri TaxID=77586 RepID=A0A0D9X5Q3_9ORYZ